MKRQISPEEFETKYYDIEGRKQLRVDEGCPLEEWTDANSDAKFGVHENGFPVFITPSELRTSDEYAEGDPFAVVEGLNRWPAFGERRLRVTLQLVEEALDCSSGVPHILDVGCGEASITAEIKKRFPEADVSGIDHSITAIEIAAVRYDDIDFSVANAYRLPFSPEFFDVIVCNNIWEHVPDPLRLLEGIKRILKTEGYLIISTPSRYRFRNMVRVCLGMPVVFMSEYHVTEYTVGQVLEQLRFGGMEPKVVDEPLRGASNGVLRFIAFKLIVPMIRAVLRLLGSHHSPEETVFYLAKKRFH